MKAGVDSIEGCEGVLLQIAETLPASVLEKMHAPPKPDVPIVDPHDLANYDGLIFGVPTRYGAAAAQVKALMDATGGLWQKGALVGKPAGIFVSTASQGGGQETTALTFMGQFVHHGMVFVPIGYTMGEKMFATEIAHGGSPWGAGTFAAPDGSRQPSEVELELARHQGAYFAKVAKKLAA